MKKDIIFEEVKDVGVAIVREQNEGETIWNVYLINFKSVSLKNVIVNSRGYGSEMNSEVKTSTLRFYFETIPAKNVVLIEPIMENLFSLNNEYWISFYVGETIYDKQFIFLPDSIQEKNFIAIPTLNKTGLLIR
jgi:hypothetical protein